MQHWIIDSSRGSTSLNAADAARLVASIGSQDRTALAAAILDVARRHIDVHRCTIFSFEAERSPRLISGASRDDGWSVFRTAARYTREFCQHDGIRQAMREQQLALPPAPARQPPTRLLLQRQRPGDIAHVEYREACYVSQHVAERVSVLARTGRDCWIATNLYRATSAPGFDDAEIAAFAGLAPLFAASAAQHYATDTDGETVYRGAITADIGALCPALTVREREVLLRLLDGLTTERIAADLAIRPTTVVTYRTRAYEKIGVRSRRELFARVLRRYGQTQAAG
jgi:DNA-binding CsgD family transcriptional regulator